MGEVVAADDVVEAPPEFVVTVDFASPCFVTACTIIPMTIFVEEGEISISSI